MLEAAESLSNVKEWHKGAPALGRINRYPYGYVEWMGGPVSPRTGVSEKVKDQLFVVIVDRHVAEDKAEDAVMDYAVSIHAVVKSDRTLNGAVTRSWLSFREKEKLFEGKTDASIAGVRLSFTVFYLIS